MICLNHANQARSFHFQFKISTYENHLILFFSKIFSDTIFLLEMIKCSCMVGGHPGFLQRLRSTFLNLLPTTAQTVHPIESDPLPLAHLPLLTLFPHLQPLFSLCFHFLLGDTMVKLSLLCKAAFFPIGIRRCWGSTFVLLSFFTRGAKFKPLQLSCKNTEECL